MELKSYQQQVIKDLEKYLNYVRHYQEPGTAFDKFWESQLGAYNLSIDKGMQPYKDNVPGAYHICIKVPTAGGKTFIACNALHSIFNAFPPTKPKVAVWLVPWSNLLDQTIASLSDPEHPYRKRLNSLFNNRVMVYSKEDLLQGTSFNPTVVQEQLSIIVMSFASLRARNKDDRKVYQENSNLASFANYVINKPILLKEYEETALINVLRSLNPVLIIDESHNAESELSVGMLRSLNPSFVLDLTATPKENSNIISIVPAIDLKKENMVKLPVIVYNHEDKTEVIDSALHLRKKLELLALHEEKKGGKYIRPIVLFQAQPRTGEENTTFDKLKKQLISTGIPEEEIKIKTADKDELNGIDLSSRHCPVRYIITINALKEGWDCPFAYILASLADKSSAVDVEQLLGRVLRQPYVLKHEAPLLNISYVLTASVKFNETLQNIVKGLQASGFSEKDYRQKDMMPEEVKREFIENHAEAIWANDQNGIPSEEIDSNRIKFDPGNTFIKHPSLNQIENLALDKYLEFESGIETQKSIEQNHNDAHRLGDKVRRYRMLEPHRQVALKLKIPQFFLIVKENRFIDTGKILLNQEALISERFNLSKEDINIDFDQVNSSLTEIDVDENNIARYGRPEDSAFAETLMQYIFSKPYESKIKDIVHILVNAIGDIAVIPQKDIYKYVERILREMPEEKLQDVMHRTFNYAEKIKIKIKQLVERSAETTFENLIAAKRIKAEPSWRFPEYIIPGGSTGYSIRKPLYENEASMNSFEASVILDLASLPNIIFWHRNLGRGKGFAINGYKSRHYPDFILYTESGNIILVETKGDDRDNSDSEAKCHLGMLWEKLAGENFSYIMIFERNAIEGAFNRIDAKQLVAQL